MESLQTDKPVSYKKNAAVWQISNILKVHVIFNMLFADCHTRSP